MIKLVMNRLGVTWGEDGDDIIVPENQSLTIEPDLGNAIPEISVMPWPSFPTDLIEHCHRSGDPVQRFYPFSRLDVPFQDVTLQISWLAWAHKLCCVTPTDVLSKAPRNLPASSLTAQTSGPAWRLC